jgi:predicted nucleotidyltransferase
MKRHLQTFQQFINEADDPTYYQETFYFTILVSMTKDVGGSRDETKNDIRALPEVLTVTLVEPERGGIQRDVGGKYLSTLKLHVRKPKDADKSALMKSVVVHIGGFRGVTVLRFKEHKPKPRRKPFHGTYELNELDYQNVRRQKAAEYGKEKAQYLGYGKKGEAAPQKTGGTPFTKTPPSAKRRGKSAAPVVGDTGGWGASSLEEDILLKVGSISDELLAFDVQPHLNQEIWEGDADIYPSVRHALLEIVEEFLEGLDLEVEVKDIVVTGSLANYNWSKFSDIDIHILLNFHEVNDNTRMVKKFFDAVRSRWNKLHDIRIKGHEVEIYVQDETEPHTSTGVYSLLDSEWRVKPQKIKPEIDKQTAQKKMDSIVRELDKLSSLYDNRHYDKSFELAERIKDKIGRMRKSGLQKTGIYSPENLAFKMLRRSGDIERLFDIYTRSYDQVYSLDQ